MPLVTRHLSLVTARRSRALVTRHLSFVTRHCAAQPRARHSSLVTRTISYLLSAALCAAPCAALALDGSAVVTGGEVQFFGAAETNWLNGSELLIKFTGEGSFILPGLTRARILAVGGGGGGAGICSAAAAMVSPYGAGAGGGAGGFVEVTNVFSAATYAVAVGAGGAGGASASAHSAGRYSGVSGGDTTLTTNNVAVITAKGGGGGGGETVGLDGGSGGGGSQFRRSSGASGGDARVGGAGTDGQGHAGGTGDASLYAGGGGGAGSAGAPASTTNPIGGDGRASDITGESVYYAGGGGGGYNDQTFTGLHDPIAGGKGGGGSGGYGRNVARTDATFYGGGGGGCGALATSSTTRGGSGYQGVVYVRISVIAVEEIVKPTDQTVDFDGVEHVLVPATPAYVITDLTEGSPTYGQVVSSVTATDAGTYKAKVTLVDGFEWSTGGDDEVTVTLTINKATPVISNLRLRSWIVGTPAGATPNPSCTVSIAVEPTYEYGDSATGPWSADKPTTAGTHYLRASIAETASDNAASAVTTFEIWAGPGDVYRDYVEITIGAASSPVADFVYELKLAENAPVGFLYEQAGETGEDLTITDANGVALPYTVGNWNTAGESTLYVTLPELATSPQVIRLFWFVREGKTPPSHAAADTPSGVPQPSYDFDLVVRDGKRVNYWLTYPTIAATKWDSSEPAPDYTVGTVAEGLSSLLYSTNLNTGAVSPGMPTTGGSFSVVFCPYDPAGDYEPLEYGIDVVIVGHVHYGDLSGDYCGEEDGLTRNGRVLLANDDSAPGGFAVTGQSYWQTDSAAYATYWEHYAEHSVNSSEFPYLRPYANHTLYAKDMNGNVGALWTLENVIIGCTYASGPTMRSNGCYLPNSPTAKAISSEAAPAGLSEQGTMVMRNIKDEAIIMSPLYTNGVGTIYFDVVNGNTEYAGDGCYKIQVEVSTDGGVHYEPYKMKPFKREGTAAFVADQTDTKELTLAITTGGTADNFYRVAVPVDASGDVRFKIVRTAQIPGTTWGPDSDGFILVDNILVSYPKSTASLEPCGKFDNDLSGRQVMGWAASMCEPFPAVGDDGVYARAKAVVNANANAHVAVDMPITWAQMHYRWRYLEQKTNDWQTVNLRPGAGYTSTEPLALPADEGDVEFWYEYIVQLPTYKYHDYSGLDIGIAGSDGKALYSEEDVTACTNNQMAVTGYTTLASGGTDWFFRLRRGKSDRESFTIYAKESEDGPVKEYPMALASNHVWRGFLPTSKVLDGGLYVRIAGRNRQTPGSTEYDLNMSRYSLAGNAGALPATDTLSAKDDDDSWAWYTVPCDARSGQILLQLQDDTLGYMVVHADYQDFNCWTDANKTDGKGLFVSTYPDAVTHLSHFSNWNETIATNACWSEPFRATKAELDSGAWPLYQPFDSAISPNTAFTVGPGQWVNGYYRDNNMGMALQMEGGGRGYIQLGDRVQPPRGLESIAFKARVSQAIEFKDFCYYMTNTTTDPTALKNYTFMSGAAFDTNVRRDFAGNASLSLVALYTPGVGCYELRVEQENASVGAAGVVSPGTTFRISLYRWAYDDAQGEVVATRLGTTTHSNGNTMFNTTSENGNYARLFISVDTSVAGETRIVGGVSRAAEANANFFASKSYREVMYRDKESNRLTSGTYGLLSANCPARFVAPSYGAAPVTYQAPTKTGLQYGNYTLAPIVTRVSCMDDIAGGKWAIGESRMVPYKLNDANWYGINALIPSTTVDVYTAPAGTADWVLKSSHTISGFGSSSSAGTTTTVPIYSLEACSVKVAAGGSSTSGRIDVTIDDLEFRQWRGESYDDDGQSGVFDDTGHGSPTNIVFTQAWVSNRVDGAGEKYKVCLLSAKRSYSTTATSIRSPCMVKDDGSGRGLGNVSFTYEDAQSNAVVLVQIATNNVSPGSFDSLTKSTSPALWTTVTNIDFSAMTPEQRKEGSVNVNVGLHGVMGVMRIALDPEAVAALTNVTDSTAFGEVTITGIAFRDEPMPDACWWGWNLRTTDEDSRMILADKANDPLKNGLALCLNNSVTDDIRVDEAAEQYKKKYPMLQTPRMAVDAVGEIEFQARLYDPAAGLARVTLYGASAADAEEGDWVRLASWDVMGAVYEPYSYSLPQGSPCKTFRLAVTGVDGVTEKMPDPDPLVPAPRVLIDEVLVREPPEVKKTFADTDIVLTNCVAVYDGQPHAIGVVTNGAIDGLTLKYCAVPGSAGPATCDLRPWTSAKPSFVDVTNVTVFVEASAPGYLTVTNQADVVITPKDIAGARVAEIPGIPYEGARLTPVPSVTDGSPSIITTNDYSLSYGANDAPGQGSVTLTGQGNYTGTKQVFFTILTAYRDLRVTVGRWGGALAVVGDATNLVTAGTSTNLPVAYGSEVAVTAVPDAGFAVSGEGSAAFGSFTTNAATAFAFVPNPDAALRWKYSSAAGRYFAQVAIPSYPGYAEALDGLAFLFADRTNAVGEVYAQLWDIAARAPQGVLLTDNGVEYRGVTLGSSAFNGKEEGARVLWGVRDESFAEPRNIVPPGERQIGLYVRKRVDPVSDNAAVAEVGNFLGYLTWTTDGTRYFLPVVEGDANGPLGTTPAQLSSLLSHSSLVTLHSSLFTRAYAPETLNAAAALGLAPATVADNAPTARIADFTVAADGSISGRVEAVAGGEASSRFGAATVRILSAETPAGPWREVRAEVDPATGAFALPAGAVSGHFFRAEIETQAVLE